MIKEQKIQKVNELAELISKYKTVGILNMYKTPARALQKIRNELFEKAVIRTAKKSTILFALEKANKTYLKEFVTNYPALILTNEDPFKLYRFLERNKTPAPAKSGDTAIIDIEVKAGPTDLAPGPAISTLTKVGIPAKVEGGKIAVMRDKIVLKTGEKVSEDLASALQLLKMEPMEIGLTVFVMSEHESVYKKEQLYLDENKILNEIMLATNYAFNLSINSGYPTKDTISLMLAKAFANAKTLGIEANLLEPGIIESVLAKAKAQAEILSKKIGG